ncbi:MAG: deoxyhypusine synthase, partial [Planctomycetes bacterium RBG_16_64_10]
MHDGCDDGLEALESLDIAASSGFADLLVRMSKTSFGARQLGQAFHVLRAMAQDTTCTIVVTVSGAMTVAKMDQVLCEMIEADLAHIIVTTGALMSHGLSAAIGGVHYKYDPQFSDRQLYECGYNRIYDTLEMEANLSRAQQTVSDVLGGIDSSRPTCSHELNRALGRHLVEQGQMPSILGCAYRKEVPVYVPAFTDSELGLAVATHFLGQDGGGQGEGGSSFFSKLPIFNPFLDLYDYAQRALAAQSLGIVTIGGGVPRNWAQQIGPFFDVINARLSTQFAVPRFRYGVRICPEPDHWGGLSGCSYAEGVSWGKFVDPAEGGRFAEVPCDATIAWPILVRAVLESLGVLPRGEDP